MTNAQAYPEDLLEQALKLGTSTIHEASGLASSATDTNIRPVWKGAAVAGAAYTLQCSPGDNLAIHHAMKKAPAGSILVIDTKGFMAGYWGEVLTVSAKTSGIRGLVTDGGVRDIDALEAHQFPVFARGVCMRGTLKASFGSVGEPLHFTGTPVKAGDLVVADTDGVVIIPAEHVAETMAKSHARFQKEEKMMEELRQGATTYDLLGLTG